MQRVVHLLGCMERGSRKRRSNSSCVAEVRRVDLQWAFPGGETPEFILQYGWRKGSQVVSLLQ
eukprot:7874865-Prorocentrum_lima.AAC.1